MVLSSVISVLFLPSSRILYGTLSILMVRPLEPMVISRLDITEKLSILTLTITSSNINNNSNNNSSSNNINTENNNNNNNNLVQFLLWGLERGCN